MHQTKGKAGFVSGFVTATALCGVLVAFAAVGIYTPDPHGDWIRDTNVYQPGTDDQINVLADIQPGAAIQMMEVGLRLNVLNQAGKKGNWQLANHEAEEIEEALKKLGILRPALQGSLESFITASLEPVITAVAAEDKAQFKTAMNGMVAACNTCHVDFGKAFFVVKPGKGALPLK